MRRRNEREGVEGERRLHGISRLLAAASLGAGIALLLAPRSGEEARRAIGRGYRKAKKNISRRAADLRERAEEVLERGHGFGLLHGARRGEAVRRRA